MNERSTSIRDRILDLVQKALDEFDKPNYRLSNIIRKAIRVARLRRDYNNLLWLEFEMRSSLLESLKSPTLEEMRQHYSKEHFGRLVIEVTKSYLNERRIEKGETVAKENRYRFLSVADVEGFLNFFVAEEKFEDVPSNTGTKIRSVMLEQKQFLNRIGYRVHEFLSLAESQLMEGLILSDIFERNRRYVDGRLSEIAPDVLEKFKIVYRRLGEGDTEARSQALLTCRRILKSLADHLYPPPDKPVTGADGKERKLTDEQYINRLWQFVSNNVKGHSAGELLLTQIEDLGNRINRVYDLTCKGTHVDVSESEANQCVIQTYMTVGDILRIAEGDSGIFAKIPDILTDS